MRLPNRLVIRPAICLLVMICTSAFQVQSQPCPPLENPILFGQSETAIFCRNSIIGFGVSNSKAWQKYDFTLQGDAGFFRKAGPVDGNGGQLSVAAVMNSARDAGTYSITAANGCLQSTPVTFHAYYGNIDNLTITGWGADSVYFSWTPSGSTGVIYYEYAVTTIADPNNPAIAWGLPITSTSARAGGLIPGTNYFIHARIERIIDGGSEVDFYNYNACNTLPVQTLSFKHCSTPTNAGSIFPKVSSICYYGWGSYGSQTLMAPTGSSYQWYQNDVVIPGATGATYMANMPAEYKVKITTATGCEGLVSAALVTYQPDINPAVTVPSVYCLGDSAGIGISNTIAGQIYTIQKNGNTISLEGVGNAIESKDTVWYRFKIDSIQQSGYYSVTLPAPCYAISGGVYVDLITSPVTDLEVTNISDEAVSFEWNYTASPGPNDYEYIATLSPGAPTIAPFTTLNQNAVIHGLQPATKYYIHVRPKCKEGSANWTTISVTTNSTSSACSSISSIGICSPVVASIIPGEGVWDFSGEYPYNSTGSWTGGKERIFSITPPDDGVYYLNVTAASGSISYLYRNTDAACDRFGWIGIRAISATGKFPIGMLEAGRTYYLLLDNMTYDAVSHTFSVCKAAVAPPATFNTCINISVPYYVPPHSSKEEFLVDNNGNLIASLDFSRSSSGANNFTASYKVNNAAVRKDLYNREYLDRTLVLPALDCKVKFYFPNTELDRMINLTDDGIGDVDELVQLNASIGNAICTAVLPTTLQFAKATQYGAYGSLGSFVSFDMNTSATSTFYLHGGNAALNYQLTLANFFQDFNLSETPYGWTANNSAPVIFMSSSSNPSTLAYSGNRFVWFNSYGYGAGVESRLISPPVRTTSTASVTVDFIWYQNNNPNYSTGNYLNEGVQVQYSLNGTTWTDVGTLIPRHNGTLAAGTGAWRKFRTILPAGAGNQANIYIAFKFHSEYGDNCGLDMVAAYASTSPCTTFTQPLTITGQTSSSVSFSWPAVAGATGYQYGINTGGIPPASPQLTTTTSRTISSLQPSTSYYLHVRPQCSGGTYGAWTSIQVTTAAAAPDCIFSPDLTLDQPQPVIIPPGAGVWDFSGVYPFNSIGYATPGREKVYRFTAPSDGIYYLEVLSSSGEYVDYFYKVASSGCEQVGWLGIDDISQPCIRPIGRFNELETVYILLDSESEDEVRHTFRIRKAWLNPMQTSDCISAYVDNPVPANCYKPEYVLDEAGNLIAALDFSNVSNAPGFTWINVSTNNGPIRRDAMNREYLDRQYNLQSAVAPNGPIGMKLFFKNTELNRLIDQYDDGVTDVASAADLSVSMGNVACPTNFSESGTALLPQTGNQYHWYMDAWNVELIAPSSGTFYLHKGPDALSVGAERSCPGSNLAFNMPSQGTGFVYQWQVNIGSGFVSLSNSTIYSGVNSNTLNLTNPPSSINGYEFRCMASRDTDTVVSSIRKVRILALWSGLSNSDWNTPANWDCNVVPDGETDVIVGFSFNPPIISTDNSCRSLTTQPGATITVAPAGKLTITGKE